MVLYYLFELAGVAWNCRIADSWQNEPNPRFDGELAE